jgi:hypothetical protein
MEQQLLNKTPQNLDFSYETMCHTKILHNDYELCISIPQSKKYIGYITLIQEQPSFLCETNLNPFYPVLIIYELNKYRKVSNIYRIATVNFTFCEIVSWMEETIFYGSIINNFFIIEDILYQNGISLRNYIFKDKINIIIRILSLNDYFDFIPQQSDQKQFGSHQSTITQQHFENHTQKNIIPPVSLKFVLPFIFKNNGENTITQLLNEIPYPIHHIQYRSISKLKPILNVTVSRNGDLNLNNVINTTTVKKQSPPSSPSSCLDKFKTGFKFNYNKPQYKKRTVFEVIADNQYDVYLLYAYNNISITDNDDTKTIKKHIFVDIALISEYKTSKLMNTIFRKIKENDNLDYIEESDDENEFENKDPNKFIYLNKKVNMECKFNYKFKKWIPIQLIENNINFGKIVPISNL